MSDKFSQPSNTYINRGWLNESMIAGCRRSGLVPTLAEVEGNLLWSP